METPDGDDKWRFGTTNPVPGINIQNGVRLGNWYPRFAFSGPIERGRFWFSDAISLQHTFTLVRELPDDANTSSEWAGDNLFRLQYNFSPKHILYASFLYNLTQDGPALSIPDSADRGRCSPARAARFRFAERSDLD